MKATVEDPDGRLRPETKAWLESNPEDAGPVTFYVLAGWEKYWAYPSMPRWLRPTWASRALMEV